MFWFELSLNQIEVPGENVSGIPVGVFVLFPKECGLSVLWNDQLRLVRTLDLVAIVEEISLDDTH